jgi:signal transduction histidine kinase
MCREVKSDVLRVLMVDDSGDDAEIVARELKQGGRDVHVERVCDAVGMRQQLGRGPWDLVLSDWTMPSFSGAAALEVLKGAGLDVPFIIVSGTVTEELAIKAMRAGARDWVVKGKLGRLRPAVDRELEDSVERRRAAESLKRSEAVLRQSQKMDAIGGLAAGVAHDFNNVLSVIIAHSDVLLMGRDGVQGEVRESVQEIREAAGRAADLTRQLLAFSRQQILQPRRTDLTRVVAGMAKMLRRLIGEDVELEIVAPSALGEVLVDPGQMEQVIMNLAVNARDAMPHGGTLTIEAADVDLAPTDAAVECGARPGPQVMLSVSDTGVGMDVATQARVFEPFFTTKRPGSGTGLGLATVLGIVQQSGGAIVMTSEPARGTAFRIYLPRLDPEERKGQEPARGPSEVRSAPRGRETVLLVEDDAALRAVLVSVLESHGYQVLEASNGREALMLCETVRDRPIDLAITDVVMPQMGGREFATQLAVARPDTRVLYMSGYTDGAIVRHGVLEPGVAFIHKPVPPVLLLERVRTLLDEGGPAR